MFNSPHDDIQNTIDAYNKQQNSVMWNAALGQAQANSQWIHGSTQFPLNGALSSGIAPANIVTAMDTESLRRDAENKRMVADAAEEAYKRRLRTTPLNGPTPAQLEESEALRNAWEAFEIIRNLQGK